MPSWSLPTLDECRRKTRNGGAHLCNSLTHCFITVAGHTRRVGDVSKFECQRAYLFSNKMNFFFKTKTGKHVSQLTRMMSIESSFPNPFRLPEFHLLFACAIPTTNESSFAGTQTSNCKSRAECKTGLR